MQTARRFSTRLRFFGRKENFIRKIYLAALMPNVIAVLGGTINVFFDGVLVGQRLHEAGLSAVSQSLPIYLILCTVGSLFGSGASFISSQAFGENDKEKGVRIFRATLTTAFIAGIAVCALGLVLLNPITKVLSTPETYDMVRDYVGITLIGGVFKVLLYVPFFYLRLEGKNKRSASAMLTMTVLNIILDYLLLFVFDNIFPNPIQGAAWASVLATAVACIMSFAYLFTDHSNFTFGVAFYKMDDWMEVINYGSPMALNNVLSSFRILLLNLILKSMSLSGMVAVFAVINNINEFSLCIQNGVPQTASAMTGIFFGEKDSKALKDLVKEELRCGMALSAVYAIVLIGFSDNVAALFGATVDCSIAAVCFAASLFIATANSTLSYYFNAIGKIELANLITVCRGFVLMVMFCYLFSATGEYVWLFYPTTELLTLLIVLWIGLYVARKENLTKFYLIDESFEKSGKSVSYTVSCDEEEICMISKHISGFCEENEFSPKKSMAISLAIEEILIIISQKSLMGEGTMDLRVLENGDDAIVRVRSGGARYNPIEEMTGDLDYMGVQMINKMATKIEYLSSLGVNTLIIYL